MYKPFLSLLLLFSLFIQAQKVLPEFDGIVSPKEWEGAETFKINYEIDPGNNVPSPHLTEVFITYSETDFYVGFIAYADMVNLRSSVRNRDEGYRDDKFFFLQPLLKWNPNPFTIFYIGGGTNGYSRIEEGNRYGIENSQLYVKFQYLFDW